MAYADLATIQDTDPGDILTAAWCDQARDNGEFLIDPPACSVFMSTSQTISSTVDASMNADSEQFDNNAMHSTVTNTSRITIQTTGRYLFVMTVAWPLDTDGYRLLGLRVNGATTYNVATVPAAPSLPTLISGVRLLTLTAGDYVECRTRHTAGNDLDVELREFGATFLTR